MTRVREPHTSRDELWIDIGRTHGRPSVTVRGEIDAYSAPVLRHVLDDLTFGQSTVFVDVDLSGVRFMDAAAIGVLCRAHRRLEDRGGSLVLVGTTPGIDRVLELAGLARLLTRQGSTPGPVVAAVGPQIGEQRDEQRTAG